MKIYYDHKKDPLYLRFDEKNQQILNKELLKILFLILVKEID